MNRCIYIFEYFVGALICILSIASLIAGIVIFIYPSATTCMEENLNDTNCTLETWEYYLLGILLVIISICIFVFGVYVLSKIDKINNGIPPKVVAEI